MLAETWDGPVPDDALVRFKVDAARALTPHHRTGHVPLHDTPPPHTGRMVVVSILMRLTVDTAMRMFYPFLPEISRGLGITLSQGGLLMSLR